MTKPGKLVISPKLLIAQSNHAIFLLAYTKEIVKGGYLAPKVDDIYNATKVKTKRSVIRYSNSEKELSYIFEISRPQFFLKKK